MVWAVYQAMSFVVHRGQPGRRRKERRELQMNLKRVKKERPAAHVPVQNDLSSASIFTHPQPSSTFFTRLPPELRRRIYSYVLGNKLINLYHVPGRIVHLHFPRTHWTDQDLSDNEITDHILEPYNVPTRKAKYWPSQIGGRPRIDHFHSLPISLFQTCHAAYAEASSELYESKIFEIASPLALIYLYDLYLIPRSRFALIRHLRFVWCFSPDDVPYPPFDSGTWSQFWELVAQMSLTSLQVEILAHQDVSEEDDWVKEMMRVTGVKNVKVNIGRFMAEITVRQPVVETKLRRRWRSALGERS